MKNVFIFGVVALLLVTQSVFAEKTAMKTIDLPPPEIKGNLSLQESIKKRRSLREFKPTPLTVEEIGQLTWSAQGITDERRRLRAAPSAGATYPLEIYVATPDGLFQYVPQGHKLVLRLKDDLREKLSRAALNQRWVAQAPAVFVIAADYDRTARRYGRRATRYVDIEVGCASENIALQAVALKLGAVMVGAFDDGAVKKVLDLPPGQTPLILIPIGHPRK